MKAASSIVTYLLITFISIVSLSILTFVITEYYKNTTKSLIESSFRQLAVYTSGELAKIYDVQSESTTYPENNRSIVLFNTTLEYPLTIGGVNYKVEFVSNSGIWTFINITGPSVVKDETYGNKIVFKTTQEPLVEYYVTVPNLPVGIQGMHESGNPPKLSYVRYNYNNGLYDRIILGNDKIIFISAINEQN